MGRLRVLNTIDWRHHRGGWRTAMSRLKTEVHSERGTLFIGCVEDHMLENGPVNEPWVGVLHQVPRSAVNWFPDLNRFLKTRQWKESASFCRGIWVLSEYSRWCLRAWSLAMPIDILSHPASTPRMKFSYRKFRSNDNKLVLSIGHNQRRYKPYFSLRAYGYRKMLLLSHESHRGRIQALGRYRKFILSERVSNRVYDELLSKNIVFLNLIEAAAVNTIVECIVRATPILINRHPAVIEYLGPEYPFYYRDVAEASRKLRDEEAILRTVEYLRRLPLRDRLRIDAFVRDMKASRIYTSLPVPRGSRKQKRPISSRVRQATAAPTSNLMSLTEA